MRIRISDNNVAVHPSADCNSSNRYSRNNIKTVTETLFDCVGDSTAVWQDHFT